MTGYLSNSSYCWRCRLRCRRSPLPFFLAMVLYPPDYNSFQHLPDYNTWVKEASEMADREAFKSRHSFKKFTENVRPSNEHILF